MEGRIRRNKLWDVFAKPEVELFVNWGQIAPDFVADLRAAIGHPSDDAGLTRLVTEFGNLSLEFCSAG
jgi:MmyB-like transcription regulator ligand binding domain